MSRYDIKDEYDLEAQREVRLTRFTSSLDCTLHFAKDKDITNLPADLENRLVTLELHENEENRANRIGKYFIIYSIIASIHYCLEKLSGSIQIFVTYSCN